VPLYSSKSSICESLFEFLGTSLIDLNPRKGATGQGVLPVSYSVLLSHVLYYSDAVLGWYGSDGLFRDVYNGMRKRVVTRATFAEPGMVSVSSRRSYGVSASEPLLLTILYVLESIALPQQNESSLLTRLVARTG